MHFISQCSWCLHQSFHSHGEEALFESVGGSLHSSEPARREPGEQRMSGLGGVIQDICGSLQETLRSSHPGTGEGRRQATQPS